MKTHLVGLLALAGVVAALVTPAAAEAQNNTTSTLAANPAPPPSSAPKLSAAELEKLVMPIALHADPLIAILLPAAVYPLEIVQAARFAKDTNNTAKVDEQDWDENVKAVAKFPELIAKMDTDLSWTMQLGQAFLDQPKELMDTIQALRGKAQKAGTLRSTEQQVVTVTNVVVVQTNFTQITTVTNQVVQVQPANPQVIYVPTYPPAVYYPPPAYVYNPYPKVNGEISPLGPWVALAQDEGYFKGNIAANAAPQPFHGYFFKILTRQGKNAPRGKYGYIINGNMIGGFALVGWPASYGDSGIITFIVNQQGRVYQKDLGPRTDKVVSTIKAYDPDPTWRLSPD